MTAYYAMGDFVCETANSPGTGAFTLAGPIAGRAAWSTIGAASGASVPYSATDGTNFETGVGTFTSGSPNKISRTKIFKTSNGNTSPVNFTGAVLVSSASLSETSAPRDGLAYLHQNFGGITLQETASYQSFGANNVADQTITAVGTVLDADLYVKAYIPGGNTFNVVLTILDSGGNVISRVLDTASAPSSSSARQSQVIRIRILQQVTPGQTYTAQLAYNTNAVTGAGGPTINGNFTVRSEV